MLAAINNTTTEASVIITKARLDSTSTRATDLAGSIHYKKELSPDQIGALDASGSYSYPEATNAVTSVTPSVPARLVKPVAAPVPTTQLSATVQLDLVKLVGQAELNKFPKDFQDYVKDSRDWAQRDYGAKATQINSDVSSESDAQGFKSLTATLDVAIDTSQLTPQKSADLVFTSAHVVFGVNRAGGSATVTVVSNPAYSAFQKDGQGLKEWIVSLLEQKPQEMQEVVEIMGYVDMAVTQQLQQAAAAKPQPAPAPNPKP
jgi:hypothetical protein